MNDIRYRVIFRGEIAVGADIEAVKRKIAATFKLGSNQIDKMFSGGRTIINKNSTLEVCEKTKQAFEKAGAICHIEREKDQETENITESQSEEPKPPPLPSREELERREAAAGRRSKKADEKFCASCGEIIQMKMLSCPYCGKKQKKEGMGCLPIGAIVAGIFFVGIAILGILAAIAIPQFVAYRNRALESAVRMELKTLAHAESVYYEANSRYTASLEELGYTVSHPQVTVTIVSADEDCFDAKGETGKLDKIFWINCNGELEVERKGPP
ncbi:MAG: hypothetical protein JRJ85_12955 [Deltaproteobacteria bacterium]|nr:hypothetical protein [Deltaproteobacteria bacterium]